MKRIICALLAVLLVFAFAACERQGNALSDSPDAESLETSEAPSAQSSQTEASELPVQPAAITTVPLSGGTPSSLTVEDNCGDPVALTPVNEYVEYLDEEYVMSADCQAIYDRYIGLGAAGYAVRSLREFPYASSWDSDRLPEMDWCTLMDVFQLGWSLSHNGELYDWGFNGEAAGPVDADIVEQTVLPYFEWSAEAFRRACLRTEAYDAETRLYFFGMGSGYDHRVAVTGYEQNGDLLTIDMIGWFYFSGQEEDVPIGVSHRNRLTLRLLEDGSWVYLSNELLEGTPVRLDCSSISEEGFYYGESQCESIVDGRPVNVQTLCTDGWGRRDRLTLTGAMGQTWFLTDSRLLLAAETGVYDFSLETGRYVAHTDVDALDDKPHRMLNLWVDQRIGKIVLLHVRDFALDASETPSDHYAELPTVQITLYDVDWNLLGVWDTGLVPNLARTENGWVPAPFMLNSSSYGRYTIQLERRASMVRKDGSFTAPQDYRVFDYDTGLLKTPEDLQPESSESRDTKVPDRDE